MGLASHWTLDPEVAFLNHGSFGACPAAVLDAQARYRARLEREPVTFLVREIEALYDRARAALAQYVGADPGGLVFVANATTAVNTVLRSLTFDAGDELLFTNMGYGACANALHFVQSRFDAKVVIADVPFPLESADQIVEAIVDRVGDRTRIAVIDHITSPTALVFPIERIVQELESRGVLTLVDGAHAVGQVDLRLAELGAAFYTSNCHKWLCAPKGSAFLYVREDQRGRIHPLTISHGFRFEERERPRLLHEFDWPGTHDPTPYLCVPDAIETMAGLVPGGWPQIRRRNHDLVVRARAIVCERLGLAPPCPEALLGAMATVILPDATREPILTDAGVLDPLQRELFEEEHLETWLFPYPAWPRRVLRLSAQLYNDLSEYERLADALARRL